MKTSIALTTYNGMRYIEELLDSLKNQTESADEVIIVDDCSTDGTDRFILNYIDENKLQGWLLFNNDKNVGWKINFRKAFEKCTGDIIFPCDQDDVWKEYKVAEMKSVMEKDSSILLLLSNYKEISEDRTDKIVIKGLYRNDSTIVKMKFGYSSLIEMRPGCVMCFRNEVYKMMKEKDESSMPHDTMLWGYAAINDGMALYNRITMMYRRHSGSATAPKESFNLKGRIETLELELKACRFFIDRCIERGDMKKERMLKSQESFYIDRINYLSKKAVINLAVFMMRNRKHYATYRNMLSDIVACYK